MIATLLLLLAPGALPQDAPDSLPVVQVTADNTVVTESCQLAFPQEPLHDTDGDGVVHIVGDDIVVDFAGAHLIGASDDTPPDERTGVGLRVLGKNVTVRNARISGFHCGLYATGADGLVVERCAIGDGFRQRLASTPTTEAPEDWLEPHDNDANEWLEKYGAAVYVEDSRGVRIHDVVARDVQNGILLDRVEESQIFDNDCSFLSGWGIGLWRSSHNQLLKNAVDFCIRGYSHNVYNRGQDSAGFLLFEQSSRNVIAENSATHCGDGIFVFAGREALGERPPVDADGTPVETDAEYYKRRGCDGNVFFRNDLSYSAAHGLEVTFSFSNTIDSNRLVGNAICGIWGGYSQNSKIHRNIIEDNGDMPYGLERGGINIENGRRNLITFNRFGGNPCGVHLWGEENARLDSTPWAQANGTKCAANRIHDNEFQSDDIAIQIRDAPGNIATQNAFESVGRDVVFTPESSRPGLRINAASSAPPEPEYENIGRTHPVGGRNHQRGRQFIVMTEWGPYDYSRPLLQRQARLTDYHEFFLHSPARDFSAEVEGEVELEIERRSEPPRLRVSARDGGELVPYTLRVVSGNDTLEHSALIAAAPWVVWSFPWEHDPREDLDAWHAEARDRHVTITVPSLTLPFGNHGPGDLALASEELRAAQVPHNRFGTIATSQLRMPAGRWRLRTRSDDGIRVWADGELLIDDWTHHVPTEHSAVLELDETRSIDLRVEHFELDGFALLELDIEAAD